MPPKNLIRQPQDVTPATTAPIRPGTPVVPITPRENEALNEVARTQGVDKAEALRQIVEKLPPQPPQKQSVTDQTLSKIQQARELSLTSDDPNDPLNQMMRYGFYKDLKKDMKKGDEERMSTRELMEMNMVNMQMLIMQKSMGEGGGQANTAITQFMADMKSEMEKQRQFYEQRLKEQDDRIREMVFEKRIQTMEEKQDQTASDMSQQLADIGSRLELYRNIPTNASPEQKKDAVSHLEELGGQVDRIRKALAPFGILQPSSSLPPPPGTQGQGDQYRKPDGSVDYFRYTVDKLDNTIGRAMEAWQKKTPERKQIAETPPPEPSKTEATYRQLSPEEYADILVNKTSLSPDEQQWLNSYNAYLEQQQAKLTPRKKSKQPAEGCRVCGNPAIYQEGYCEPCYMNRVPDQVVDQPQPKKSVLERLREQENEELRRTQGLV